MPDTQLTETTKDVFFARQDRALSLEADYGVHWRHEPFTWPVWRVSYIRNTGEVYAIEQHARARVIILGTVPADDPAIDGIYYRTLDQILDGWADEPHRDITWVADRIAAWPGVTG